MSMNELKEFRRRCDDTIDFPGGNTANSKVIDEIMSDVGKKVTVKLHAPGYCVCRTDRM